VLGALARRVRSFQVGDPQWQKHNVIRALSRLDVTVTRTD
jgi:hypothetical protein